MRYYDYSKTQLENEANRLNESFDKERLVRPKKIDMYDVVDFIHCTPDWFYLSPDQSILEMTASTYEQISSLSSKNLALGLDIMATTSDGLIKLPMSSRRKAYRGFLTRLRPTKMSFLQQGSYVISLCQCTD